MQYLNTLYERYGLVGLYRLLIDFVITRIFFPKLRLVRSPKYIRGRRYINLGSDITTGVALRLDAFKLVEGIEPLLRIGRGTQINDYVHIGCVNSVSIGNNVLIASKVFITDHCHGFFKSGDPQVFVSPAQRDISSLPVTIDDDVWLGEGVIILPGVTIGKGTIVGAGSVVTKSFPSYVVCAGNPAKIIKVFDSKVSQWRSVL